MPHTIRNDIGWERVWWRDRNDGKVNYAQLHVHMISLMFLTGHKHSLQFIRWPPGPKNALINDMSMQRSMPGTLSIVETSL